MERKLMFIIKVFENYSVQKGYHDYLNKKELRMLLEMEIPNFISVRFLSESSEYGLH